MAGIEAVSGESGIRCNGVGLLLSLSVRGKL
jgi:hypothetical protein